MSDEASWMVFAESGDSVALHRPIPYSGGHGYSHRIDIRAGPFTGTIEATSYETLVALDRFRSELEGLYRSLKGKALLRGGYENFDLSLTGDGLGHIKVDVTAMAGPLMDTRLTYSFFIDQTQLPQAIAALKEF